MSVFSANVLTATRANAAANDSKPPMLGALSMGGGAMISPTALGGTNGADARLIHGDCWEQIEGSETVNIVKNLTTAVTQNETRTVYGNLVNKVVGTTSDTRTGVHHQWNVSPRFEEYLHILTQNHHEKLSIHQPTTTWEIIQSYITMKAASFSVTGLSLSTTASSASLTGSSASATVISVGCNVFSSTKESFSVKDLDIGLHIRGMITEIKAVKIKAAVSHLKAIGANLCAGIAANLDSPFA
jgi:hypothetical protein